MSKLRVKAKGAGITAEAKMPKFFVCYLLPTTCRANFDKVQCYEV